MDYQVRRSWKSPARQRGAAALLFAVVLLMVITLVTLYTAGPVRTEQQVTANEYRGLQALNAADAGLYYFLGVLRDQIENEAPVQMSQLDNNCRGVLTDGRAVRSFVLGNIEMLTSDMELVSRNGTPGTPDIRRCVEDVDLGVIAWNAEPIPAEAFFARVAVTGFSDDFEAVRNVQHLISIRGSDPFPLGPVSLGIDPNAPAAPLVAKGSVDLNGTFKIPDGSPRIIAGSGVDTQGAVDIPNGEITQNDSDLAGMSGDDFFEMFMGASKADLAANSFTITQEGNKAVKLTAAASQQAAAQGRTIIFINGDADINTSGNPKDPTNWMGTPDAPITLVVTGELSLSGNQQFYGTIYTVSGVVKGNGTIDVYGSVISETDFKGIGTMVIHHDVMSRGRLPDDLRENLIDVDATRNLGGLVPGFWRDWN